MIHRTICLLFLFAAVATAQTTSFKETNNVYSEAHDFYVDLHEHPELSGHETQTAAKLASRLRNAGYEVTEHVGGTGVVAILKNGSGPTIMLRTELDALPVEEKQAWPIPAKFEPKTMPAAMFLRCMPAGTMCTWLPCSALRRLWRTARIPGTER